MLRRLCARSLLCRACRWGRATGDGDHPFIRLRHTGRAHPTRLKRDAHLQGCAADADSTCHAGLLAPVARGGREEPLSGVEPPETHHHTRVAVVFVECSSSTLSGCWQLCRKCSPSSLWCPCLRVLAQFDHSGFQPAVNRRREHREACEQGCMIDIVVSREKPRLPLCFSPQVKPGVRISRTGLPRTLVA
jgi:hypothetical protein